LNGTVAISGAKNSALPILVASLLAKDAVTLSNIPRLNDVLTEVDLISRLGSKVKFEDNVAEIKTGTVSFSVSDITSHVSRIRTSVLLLGALIHHQKVTKLPLPGGCPLGGRGVDLHMLALSNLGVKISFNDGVVTATAENLHPCDITFSFPSVGVTENTLLAACLIEGKSTVRNAAKEPEITDLANFLNGLGANIRGAGTKTIEINGVKELSGTRFSLMPDRIETGTYMAAVAVAGGDVLLKNTKCNLCESTILAFRDVGVDVTEKGDSMHVVSDGNLYPTDIVTTVYPGFSTDLQPILTAVLSVAKGQSRVTETIFNSRFDNVPELRKLGAAIDVNHQTLTIHGVPKLEGATVYAHDIRAGASLIIGALAAKGKTEITNTDQVLRGYENPIEKLQSIGCNCGLLPN